MNYGRDEMSNVDLANLGKLTPREREVLLWTSKGKTAWEISVILGISRTTVITHLRNARNKLDTTNTVQTIIEAVRRCEIPL